MTLEEANGAVIWRGPSRLDGSPVVVVATGLNPPGGKPSSNTKTGAMVQTYILRVDVHPVEAVNAGLDEAICGQCPLRPMLARAAKKALGHSVPQCYVRKETGVAAVFRAYHAGSYVDATPKQVRRLARKRGLPIRFGSYGDPGAAPTALWRALDGKRHTSYTHQWRIRPSLRRLSMASADSLADAQEAWRRGWRTFRVVRSMDDMQPNEIVCPASAEAGKKTTCARCGLCNGAPRGNDRRKSVVIFDHGPTAPKTLLPTV